MYFCKEFIQHLPLLLLNFRYLMGYMFTKYFCMTTEREMQASIAIKTVEAVNDYMKGQQVIYTSGLAVRAGRSTCHGVEKTDAFVRSRGTLPSHIGSGMQPAR